MAPAGDVNGDGLSDVVIGQGLGDGTLAGGAGSAWVVFGRRAAAASDLRSHFDGFRINGAPGLAASVADGCGGGDCAGARVSGGGDVNADGHDDVLIAAPGAGRPGKPAAGSVYVVFGKADREPVDLGRLDGHGYRIDGRLAHDRTGVSLAGAGDVNGDRHADALLSSENSGVFVVFGKPTAGTLDLTTLGQSGYRILPKALSENNDADLDPTYPVSGAGDVNGDGRADAIVGDPALSTGRTVFAGSAYVVFGRPAGGAAVNLSRPSRSGYRIRGLVEYGGVGSAVAGAGDFNGDRRGDVLLSAIGEGTTGRVYVVPGRRSTHTVTLRGRTSKVFTVERGVGDELAPLAAAGDVNRDGRADILLGSPDYVRGCGERGANGAAYVVFGQRRPMALSATDLRRRGFRINGTTSRFLGDEALSGAGDFNGDRQADLLLPGIDRQLGHLTFSVVTGRPSRLTKERERTCLLLGIAERSTRRILSRGGLPVRVGLRDVRASGYRVDLSARATGRQTRPRRSSRAAPVPAPPPLVARATIRLERPGTRPAVLRLTRAGRRLLLRRGTMRLKLSAKQAGGQRHEKAIVVQLRP